MDPPAPVCGYDGKTYKSECHLKNRRRCEKPSLHIGHEGECQESTQNKPTAGGVPRASLCDDLPASLIDPKCKTNKDKILIGGKDSLPSDPPKPRYDVSIFG